MVRKQPWDALDWELVFFPQDPLTESDVWVEEDFNMLARVFSDKTESPVYTRDLTDPLGQNSRKVRAGSENLGDLYPNGKPSPSRGYD